MQRFRLLVRWLLLALFGTVVVGVAVGIVGEFFIEWARQEGWYDNPSGRAAAFAAMITNILMSNFWVPIGLAFLGGLTLGVWLDFFLRRSGASNAKGMDENEAVDARKEQPADVELSQLRQGVRRLRDTLLGYGDPSAEREAVLAGIAEVENSRQAVWNKPAFWTLREDFLQACKVVQYVREEVGPAVAQRDAAEARALLNKTAAELDAKLAG